MEDQAGQLIVPNRSDIQYVLETRAPTSSDVNYTIPTLWTDIVNDKLYVLTDITSGSATWETLV